MAFRDCPWCGLRDAQFNVHTPMIQVTPQRGHVREWSVMSCPRCAGIVVIETGVRDGKAIVVTELPAAGQSRLVVNHLPADIERYYTTAIRVLDAGVPDAAAVQLRRALEAAAAARGITGGNLVTRIRKLIEDGHITVEFGAVVDHIRKLGNLGAHAGDEEVDEASAERALLFTTQVLRNLFEIPAELSAIAATPSAGDEG
jgi:hypothetical protein